MEDHHGWSNSSPLNTRCGWSPAAKSDPGPSRLQRDDSVEPFSPVHRPSSVIPLESPWSWPDSSLVYDPQIPWDVMFPLPPLPRPAGANQGLFMNQRLRVSDFSNTLKTPVTVNPRFLEHQQSFPSVGELDCVEGFQGLQYLGESNPFSSQESGLPTFAFSTSELLNQEARNRSISPENHGSGSEISGLCVKLNNLPGEYNGVLDDTEQQTAEREGEMEDSEIQSPLDRESEESMSGPTKKFTCHICGQTCSRRYNMAQHMITHEDSRSREHDCTVKDCSKSFYRHADLKRHMDAVSRINYTSFQH